MPEPKKPFRPNRYKNFIYCLEATRKHIYYTKNYYIFSLTLHNYNSYPQVSTHSQFWHFHGNCDVWLVIKEERHFDEKKIFYFVFFFSTNFRKWLWEIFKYLEFVVLIDFYCPVNDFIEICLTNFIRFIQQWRRLGYFFLCWFILADDNILANLNYCRFYKLKYKTCFLDVSCRK